MLAHLHRRRATGRIIANLVERTKPRKQVNHLSLLRKGAAGDHSGAEDHGGDTLRRVTRADKGDSRVPRTPLAPTEVVLSVALYYPHRPGVKLREFLVLGSQTLAELRDCLHCPTDRLLDGPTRHSGYFLIEKVFYNDMRRPENLDYSAYARTGTAPAAATGPCGSSRRRCARPLCSDWPGAQAGAGVGGRP